MDRSAFARFSLGVLVFTLAVILWGAFVRATGSGAGCGSHWPLCNGEVVPRPKQMATLVEFTHRLTSGLAFLAVAVQLLWARRLFRSNHPARRAARWGMFLMVTEALVGAGLVLLEKVADDESTARAGWMVAHLLNTFALIAVLTLVRYFAVQGPDQRQEQTPPHRRGWQTRAFIVGAFVALLLIATTGAVAALGDTLFPASSLRQGWERDLSPTAHLFVRLRVLHPLAAVLGSAYLVAFALSVRARQRRLEARRWAGALATTVAAQVSLGVVNLLLLAPVPMQLLHLLVADAIWICLVCLTVSTARENVSLVAHDAHESVARSA